MTLASSPLWHPHSFLTPKALNLLVIHNPAFGACIVVGGPEPTPRMIIAVLAKPGPQRGMGIFRCGRGRLVALGWHGVARSLDGQSRRTALDGTDNGWHGAKSTTVRPLACDGAHRVTTSVPAVVFSPLMTWLPPQVSGEKQFDSLPGVLSRVRFWTDARDP